MSRILKPALVIMAVMLASPLWVGAAPRAAKAGEKDIAEITKRIHPSVVRVEARNHTRRVATGVVIARDGYIVTTALMSPRDEKLTVTTSDGRTMDAEFLGFDTETQLALLRAKDKNLPALTLAKSGELAPGSWVGFIGISPEGTPAVTQGIVSSIGENGLRLNIWVTPGSSGGPVVDEKGQMVGLLRGAYIEEKPVVFQFRDREQVGSGFVVSRAEAPSSGMALAVPVEVVRDVTDQIREKGKVERGWLGVGIMPNDAGRAEIGSVDPQSPAELAKLKEGDVVLKLDGKDVPGPDDLASEIRKRKPGQDVVLTIERDGKPMEVKAKLGEYPEEEARRELELRFPRIFPPMRPEPPAGSKAPQPQPPGRKYLTPPVPQRPAWPAYESRKYIGVFCNELNPELAEYFGAKQGTGLIVSKLTENGPAEKAGLKVGDVIVKVDGKQVESRNDLADLVQGKKKGDKIRLDILRDKKPMTIDVTVEEEEMGGGIFQSGDFQNFLESWQGYTDAFQTEIRRWMNKYGPEIKDNMDKISDELARRSRESARDIKNLIKPPMRRV
jgi:serine protease Do